MSIPFQRKGYVANTQQNYELDNAFQAINQFQADTRISKNYTATVQDKQITLLQPGLIVTLPTLDAQAHMYTLFILDASGKAATTNQIINANTGRKIGTSGGLVTGLTISSNYGHYKLQWDGQALVWYEIA